MSRRWGIVGVVMLGTLMAVLDASIVNVALPHIMSAFGARVDQVEWVLTGFMLAAASAMPITGWLGARVGHGRLYVWALVIFTAGSGLCAIAWSLNVLIAARVLQAVGAGAIQPVGMAIMTHTFPPEERGRALGVWGVGVMVGPALGPTLGGYLTDWLGWRSIFTVNLPIGLLAIPLAAVLLPREREEWLPAFDWLGYLALFVALVVGLYTLDQGSQYGWGSPAITLGGAIAMAAFVVFLAAEWGEPHALVPLRLFRSRDLSLSLVLSVIRSLGLFGTVFLLPLFMQTLQGRTTTHTGLLLMPGAIAVAVAMPVAGFLTDRIGARWPTVTGVLLTAWSLYQYRNLGPATDAWGLIEPQLWRGAGIALLMTPVMTAAMNSVARRDAGIASWLLNVTQRAGGSAGIALLATLLGRIASAQMDRLGTSPVAQHPHLAQQAAQSAARQVGGMGTAAARGWVAQLLDTMARSRAYQDLFVLGAVVTVVGVLPALLLSGSRRRGEAVAEAVGTE